MRNRLRDDVQKIFDRKRKIWIWDAGDSDGNGNGNLVGLYHITHMANRINEFICTLMQIKNHDLFIAFMT